MITSPRLSLRLGLCGAILLGLLVLRHFTQTDGGSADIGFKPASTVFFSPPPENSRILNQRILAKCQVIELLLKGKMTLFEAGSWFRSINLASSVYPDLTWRNIPGNSDEEKICRQVIRWACCHRFPTAGKDVEALKRRLEGELEEHLRQHGSVVLPEL